MCWEGCCCEGGCCVGRTVTIDGRCGGGSFSCVVTGWVPLVLLEPCGAGIGAPPSWQFGSSNCPQSLKGVW